jgi:hypothetical protein
MSDTKQDQKFHAPGSLVLAFIFLAWFIVAYFVQWSALAKNWIVF